MMSLMPTLYDVKSDQQQSGDADDANYRCHDDEQVHGEVIEPRSAFLATPASIARLLFAINYNKSSAVAEMDDRARAK